MKLIEEEKKEAKEKVIQNGANGTNGNGAHTIIEDPSDSDSDIEDVEPVSATLVLRVVSEPPSPALSRKSSFRRDQPPAFLNHEARSDNFLQVQVQRSTSSNSISGSRKQSQSQSRPSSTTPSFYITDTDRQDSHLEQRQKRYSQISQFSSRESSISPSSSMYGLSEIDLHRPNGVNCVDFMASVSDQTKVIQQGLKTLRGEVDNPMRVLDIGQEAIVLSGLNKSAGESLKNIKNLYDETKYLKTYLEKLEAKVNYDIALRRKTSYSPPWYRRLLFVSLLICAGAFAWRRQDQAGFDRNSASLAASGVSAYTALVNYFTGAEGLPHRVVTLQ